VRNVLDVVMVVLVMVAVGGGAAVATHIYDDHNNSASDNAIEVAMRNAVRSALGSPLAQNQCKALTGLSDSEAGKVIASHSSSSSATPDTSPDLTTALEETTGRIMKEECQRVYP
jgi:hypothetical protein